MPDEFVKNVPSTYQYATCLLEYDHSLGKVVYRHVIPRDNPLRLKDKYDRFIQGKSMNQVRNTPIITGGFINSGRLTE